MRSILPLLILLLLATPALAGEIHRAAEAGDLDEVAALLDADPSLRDAQNNNQTRDLPLHSAAAAGQTEVVRLLLDRGAAVDAGDSDLSTPLDVAALRGHLETTELLLANGADLAFQDNNGAWSLSFAVAGGHQEVTDRLIDAGAPLDLRTSTGLTMVHYAALRGMTGVFDQAVAAGVDPAGVTEDGMSALHYAARGGQTAMIERLLDAGVDVDILNQRGDTPLSTAAWSNQTEAASILVSRGADVNLVDAWGRTVLWVAAARDNQVLVGALIAAGADVNHPNIYGRTPVAEAAANGNTGIVTTLITGGATLDRRDARCGRTPLHEAAIAGYGDIADLLVTAGAPLEARDRHNDTPLTLAQRYGHATIAATLVSHGAVADPDASPCPAEAGCLAACGGKSGETPALALGDSRLWYLGHSGYAVQTRDNLLIFDYWSGERTADEPALRNGYIDPAEIAGMNVTVFVSHEHGDHFDPTVFEWADQVASIRYVMGCPAETEVATNLLEPRTVQDFGAVQVRTIASNDSGLGFLVECDGVVIYHAGDHANRLRDFSGPYCAEIDWLAATGAQPDFALMPVSGCGFGDQEAVRLGVNYALEKMQPKVFIPLHAGGNEWRYRDFIDGCRNDFPGVRMVAPTHRGDHYDYRKGTIG